MNRTYHELMLRTFLCDSLFADSEDTLRFAELTGVRPVIETYPPEKAAQAYARLTRE